MIKEIEKIVKAYQTEDGKVFDTKHEAEKHQDKMNGKIKDCHRCNGSGKHLNEDYKYHVTCQTCDGKGYLRKVEVWR